MQWCRRRPIRSPRANAVADPVAGRWPSLVRERNKTTPNIAHQAVPELRNSRRGQPGKGSSPLTEVGPVLQGGLAQPSRPTWRRPYLGWGQCLSLPPLGCGLAAGGSRFLLLPCGGDLRRRRGDRGRESRGVRCCRGWGGVGRRHRRIRGRGRLGLKSLRRPGVGRTRPCGEERRGEQGDTGQQRATQEGRTEVRRDPCGPLERDGARRTAVFHPLSAARPESPATVASKTVAGCGLRAVADANSRFWSGSVHAARPAVLSSRRRRAQWAARNRRAGGRANESVGRRREAESARSPPAAWKGHHPSIA